MYHKVIRLL